MCEGSKDPETMAEDSVSWDDISITTSNSKFAVNWDVGVDTKHISAEAGKTQDISAEDGKTQNISAEDEIYERTFGVDQKYKRRG